MLLFQPRIPSPLLLWKVLEDFIPQVVTRLGTQGPDIFLLFWLPGSSFYRVGLLAVTLRLNCPVASSLTRDQTCNPFTGQWILNHWTTREVLFLSFLFFFLFLSCMFVSSYFPDLGLNPASTMKVPSPKHWVTREFSAIFSKEQLCFLQINTQERNAWGIH